MGWRQHDEPVDGNTQQSTAIHRLSVSPRTPLVTDYGDEEWTLSTGQGTKEMRTDQNETDHKEAEYKLS